MAKNLVQIIKNNPGCVAVIDNDHWSLYSLEEYQKDEEEEYAKDEDWEREKLIDSDDEFAELGDGGYGSGNRYGGDILQALAVIVGITVESV